MQGRGGGGVREEGRYLRGGGVTGLAVGLGSLQTLHVARPAVLTGHQGTGRGGQALGDRGLLNLQHTTSTLSLTSAFSVFCEG